MSDQDLRDLLIHEIGHGLAGARKGAAVIRILSETDADGVLAETRAYTVERSGPERALDIEQSEEVTVAGSAASLALAGCFDVLTPTQRLKMAPASVLVAAKVGIAQEDLDALGGEVSAQAAKWAIFYFFVCQLYRADIYAMVDKHIDDFKAGEPVVLIGQVIRETFFADPNDLASQLTAMLPSLLQTGSGLDQLATELASGAMLPASREPAEALPA